MVGEALALVVVHIMVWCAGVLLCAALYRLYYGRRR
jgi:hypothetical protein